MSSDLQSSIFSMYVLISMCPPLGIHVPTQPCIEAVCISYCNFVGYV